MPLWGMVLVKTWRKTGTCPDSLAQEARALLAFNGHGIVELIAQGKDALLIEQCVPGDSLKTYFPAREEEAIAIFAEVMNRLHQASIPENAPFPHMRDWLKALDQDWSDIPSFYMDKARMLRDELLKNPQAPDQLLHGDLHHDNILRHGESWLVIDPKGVIGEPICEIWAFLRNPEPMSMDFVLRRIDLLSQACSFAPQRIIQWGFVQSILSWVWDLEDGLKPGAPWIADILDTSLRTLVLEK